MSAASSAFGRISLGVYVSLFQSVCPVCALTFDSLDLETSFLCACTVHFQNICVSFVYKGHRVKVKVT